MKTRLFVTFIIAALLTGFVSPSVHAGGAGAKATLPGFTITLNGTVIDNKTSQYPFLTYKDITYFPMTYYDCRFLGLESIWNKNGGLNVAKTGVGWNYHKYQANMRNTNSYYSVKKAVFPIKVNGKNIDNAKEEYPLLLFRNVTYFPLTWRFAVEEFGWEYAFDKDRGLVINSNGGENAAGQLSLPIVTRENGEKGAFTMAGDYFYYEGLKGAIYQAPVQNPLDKKKVYQLPKADYSPRFVYAALKTDNGKVLLSYHTGGAVMGADHLIRLQEDGSFEELDVGYAALRLYDDYHVRVNQRFPATQNNLQIRKTGESDYQRVGNPDYVYGLVRTVHEDGAMSWKPSDDLYLMKDEIYVLGYKGIEDPASPMGIYRVNIHTNVTERVCDEPAASFKIIDDMIYFTDLKDCLYRIPIAGSRAERLTEEPVGHYDAFNGKIYYSLKSRNDQLYIYGEEDSVNPEGKLKSLEKQSGYMVAIFDKAGKSQYKMIILDDSGEAVYKTMENVLLVRIEKGKVAFVKDN